MSSKNFQIIQDPVYGYRRLDPVPDERKISRFYQSQYYDLIRKGGRAPELRRLMANGEEAEHERTWLRATLYSDICYVLNLHAPGKRVLEVGCGTGEYLLYLKENGFEAVGIEPSSDATVSAESQGLTIYNTTFENFVENCTSNNVSLFDAITFLNVLEHVPDPAYIVRITKALLNPGGIICLRVPNDYNEIQLAAQKKLNKEPWWIAVPDHINYFNFQSLHVFLEGLGYEVIHSQGDFPMELFLLMGEDYVNNPAVGSRCHKKRIDFEVSIPRDLRQRIYCALAKVGIGRNCLIFGRFKK